MTDNEKAATFIGWKPFAQSSWGEWADERGNVAPDMGDPRNYMKAWHSFYPNRPYQRIIVETNTGIWPTWRFKVWIESTMGDGRLTNCYPVDEIGRGIVKALAALYNTEHSNED